MKEKNPNYVSSHRTYKKRIATSCRICGGQLLLPEEIKKEMHIKCANNKNEKTIYMM
jgi:ribosomal protein S27E